ncbi:MAG: hypothetical protein GX141_12235, partial [Armatimonadetes bacterium]|nr:hypothetical protein [Armatimonadota bacterium]
PTWSNTLLIVTADHETGYLTRGKDVFSNVPLVDPGKGVIPVEGTHFTWNSKGHTNSLVPVYAKGYRSELLTELAKNYDAGLKLNYLDNTDFIKVMEAIYADPEAPSVPANVQASVQTPDSVLVTWTASTGKKDVIGYKIFCNGTLVGTSTTTSFTSKDLEPDKTFSFMVQSYDATGKQSAKSSPPAVCKTPAAPESADVKQNGDKPAVTAPAEPALAR